MYVDLEKMWQCLMLKHLIVITRVALESESEGNCQDPSSTNALGCNFSSNIETEKLNFRKTNGSIEIYI